MADILLGKVRAFFRTREGITAKIWDFAASDAILRVLGGKVVDPNGEDIDYRRIEVGSTAIMGPDCQNAILAMKKLAKESQEVSINQSLPIKG